MDAAHKKLHAEAKHLPCFKRLHKPGFQLRALGASDPPSLAQFRRNPAKYITALLTRVAANFIHPAWKEHIQQQHPNMQWDWQCFFWRFGVAYGALAPDDVELCIPYNCATLPPQQPNPKKPRTADPPNHGLALHRDGYLYVTLGQDIKGQPVTESVARLLCCARHGRPPADRRRPGRRYELFHVCHHSWCISPRCVRWDSHAKNMSHWHAKRRAAQQQAAAA